MSYNLHGTLRNLMTGDPSHEITLLLGKWSEGNDQAADELMPLVYNELRRMARGFLRRQPSGHSFQTTELIHETYLKLVRQDDRDFKNRAHFFGVAASAMRHLLVDHARSKHAGKRGGHRERVSLDDNIASVEAQSEQVLALDEALRQLALLDERKASVVELKYFGGLTNEEAAQVVGVSVETVKRDWRFARNWLLHELDGGPDPV